MLKPAVAKAISGEALIVFVPQLRFVLQFRAISDQLYQTPKFYSEIRQQVLKQLKSHRQLYADFAGTIIHFSSTFHQRNLIP